MRMKGFGDMNEISGTTKKLRRGQAMVVVFVYLCIIFLVAINLHIYAQNMHRLVVRSLNHLRAMNAAEAGVVATLNQMASSLFAGALNTNNSAFTFPNTAAMASFVNDPLNRTPTCDVNVNVTPAPLPALPGDYTVRSTVTNWRAGAPEDIIMETNFPSPFGEYNNVVTVAGLWDLDGGGYFMNLAAVSPPSLLNNLTVDGDITFDGGDGDGGLIRGLGFQMINLNEFDLPSMIVYQLRVQSILNMGAAGPVWGKTVYNYDIAESLPATGCEATDVVRVSAPGGMMLVRSDHAYDGTVAGIISASPWFLLGKCDGSLPLALNGVVKCKVVNENGPIQRGDLLVSSSCPGHAMRADPEKIKPGMLVGKAMQPLTGKTGVIYVLVNKR